MDDLLIISGEETNLTVGFRELNGELFFVRELSAETLVDRGDLRSKVYDLKAFELFHGDILALKQ